MWTFVVNSTNPTVNKVIRNVPVVIRNQDELEKSGYTIIGEQDTYQANIKLKGNRERLVNLRPENVFAYVDISSEKEGVQSLQIEVDTPTGVSVDTIDPEQVNLNIQKVLEKTLPVNLVISDELKDGKIVEVNQMSPEEITVKGPASAMNTVDRVEARIDDQALLDGKIHNVDLSVIDRAGNPVSEISLSNEDINISFRVFETKKVPVIINTNGSVNKNYEEKARAISPESVVLIGPEAIIKDIESIETKPIDITGLKGNKTGDIELDLPESVEVYDGENKVTFKIDVERKVVERIIIGNTDSDDKDNKTTSDKNKTNE